MMKHVGFIMDGNRRWAKARGLPTFMGHKEGAQIIQNIVQTCAQHSIAFVTLYAFSLENFKRSSEEKQFLFGIIEQELASKRQHFIDNGIRVRFIGDRALFPKNTRQTIEMIETATATCDKITVNFLFCYGGQQEIVAAAQACARDALTGIVTPEHITPEYFAKRLWLGDCPPPDLVIRTGGNMRLSNFLPYQCAYSELAFTNTYWPDFASPELEHILADFQERKRNFGQ